MAEEQRINNISLFTYFIGGGHIRRNPGEFVMINITGRPHLKEAVVTRATATETIADGAERLTDAAWANLHSALDSGKIKTDLDPVQSVVEIRTETLARMKKIASRILGKPVEGITNIQALDIVVQVAEFKEGSA